MSERNPTVTEAELHAFADEQLPTADLARIEAWLADNTEDAAKVAAWKAQNESIRTLFAPYNTAKDGDAALLRARKEGRWPSWMPRLSSVAAAAGIFIVGAVAGHYGPPLLSPPELQLTALETLPRQAQSAFLIYASEVRHPVEVGADQEAHLATWLGKRLGVTDLKVPNLQSLGFHLVGGRLLPVNDTPGALFMYEDATGKRITILIGHNPENDTTSFRFANAGPVETFYWIDGKLGYAVTGDISRETLRQVAEECYRQFPT